MSDTAEAKDPRFEARVRAHVRAQMKRLRWGPQRLADETGYSQGYLSNWLAEKRGSRGSSALFFSRVCKALRLDPLRVFEDDPAAEFWRVYVPQEPRGPEQGPDSASPPPAQAPRPHRPGAEHAPGSHPKRKAQ